jgi:hypothetical protein
MARFAPPRRKLVWANQSISNTAFLDNTLQQEDLLAAFRAAGGSMQGATVTRTLITLRFSTDAAPGPDDNLSVGLVKATTSAPDVPDVVLEPFADWALNDRLYTGANGQVGVADGANLGRWDIRSQRKLDEVGETWWLIYKKLGGGSGTVHAKIRTLLKLP